MSRFKVLVTDQVFPTLDIERELLGAIDAEILVGDGSIEQATQLGVEADALLNTYLPVTPALISRLGRCRIIARYGIGVDNVDLAAAKEAGIIVTNVPDYSVEEVAAHAAAMMLSLLRKLPQADSHFRGGGWGIEALRPIQRISELTFGLIGFGRIARRLAASIEVLGAKLIVHDPYVSAGPGIPPLVSLSELAAGADVISVHSPLTAETEGMINASFIDRMRRGAFLVNTSRGKLVVLDDVLAALRSGKLGGAGLDVFDVEPMDPSRIKGVPNLVLSPHMAYYSEQSLAESQQKAATQIVKVLTGGDPDYRVNP
ncbi:MAG: C-terminal binding protein [Acidimicrobiia bacterium]|nr:C-terminal binding protein [Acidimicrobiia bacterium]